MQWSTLSVAAFTGEGPWLLGLGGSGWLGWSGRSDWSGRSSGSDPVGLVGLVGWVAWSGVRGRWGGSGRLVTAPQDRADSILPQGCVMVTECNGLLFRSPRPLVRVPGWVGRVGWVRRVDRIGRGGQAVGLVGLVGWVAWSGVRGQWGGSGRLESVLASLVSESDVWSRNLGAWSLNLVSCWSLIPPCWSLIRPCWSRNPVSGLRIWLPGL